MAKVAVALGRWSTSTANTRHFLCPCSGGATVSRTITSFSCLLDAFTSSLSSSPSPPPTVRHLRVFPNRPHRTAGTRGRGLKLPGRFPLENSSFPEEGDGDFDKSEESDSGEEPVLPKKSRNQKKSEARRAVRWGMDLAKFSPAQIKRILRAASLEKEAFDALMLVKKLGPDVREGRRRQFNYIGKLLRQADHELMDDLIQSTKDGDSNKVQDLCGQASSAGEDAFEEDSDYDDEHADYVDIANRWLDGLIYKDSSIINEIYSIYNVEYNRQEGVCSCVVSHRALGCSVQSRASSRLEAGTGWGCGSSKKSRAAAGDVEALLSVRADVDLEEGYCGSISSPARWGSWRDLAAPSCALRRFWREP